MGALLVFGKRSVLPRFDPPSISSHLAMLVQRQCRCPDKEIHCQSRANRMLDESRKRLVQDLESKIAAQKRNNELQLFAPQSESQRSALFKTMFLASRSAGAEA
jgi:hypothetical protein